MLATLPAEKEVVLLEPLSTVDISDGVQQMAVREEPVPKHTAVREEPFPIDCFEPEREDGNVEYKWKLTDESAERVARLASQMRYRCNVSVPRAAAGV